MKKFSSAVVITAILVLSLAGCSSSEAGSDTPVVIAGDTTVSQDEAEEQSDAGDAGQASTEDDMFTFVYEGTAIEMGAPAQPVLDALGDDYEETEAPSCAYQGSDIAYTYDHLIIRAYTESTDDDEPKICGVEFRDDTVFTPEGIAFLSTHDDVVSVYGEPYAEAEGGIVYNNGTVSLNFFINDGVVSGISYTLNVE